MRTTDEIKRLREWLIEQEWTMRSPVRPIETCSQVWSKIRLGSQCSSEQRGGVPVEIKIYDLEQPLEVEISLKAQKADGVWVDFLFYSFPGGDLVEQVETQVSSLVRAWNSCAGATVIT
jgi:hypothetical protein